MAENSPTHNLIAESVKNAELLRFRMTSHAAKALLFLNRVNPLGIGPINFDPEGGKREPDPAPEKPWFYTSELHWALKMILLNIPIIRDHIGEQKPQYLPDDGIIEDDKSSGHY